MYKLFVFFIFLFFTSNAVSQVNPVKNLVGLKESDVKAYFRALSVTRLEGGEDIITETSVDKQGNLVYKFMAPTRSEDKVNFIAIVCVFTLTNSGEEICTAQMIFGTDKSAYNNLREVKYKYNKVGDNVWEHDFGESIKIIAKYEKSDTFYTLYYYLQ